VREYAFGEYAVRVGLPLSASRPAAALGVLCCNAFGVSAAPPHASFTTGSSGAYLDDLIADSQQRNLATETPRLLATRVRSAALLSGPFHE